MNARMAGFSPCSFLVSPSGGAMTRPYSKHQKATAVIAAELTSNLAVQRASGIPESSIRRWRDDPEMAKYVDKTREDLADGTQMLAHRALELISKRLPDFEPRELVTLYGVLVDKAQLLSGHATSRTESRDITGTLEDADIAAAIREAVAITAPGRTAEAPEGTPEG
jgi:hypothetical protein